LSLVFEFLERNKVSKKLFALLVEEMYMHLGNVEEKKLNAFLLVLYDEHEGNE
jgi:hypothetical protein